MYKKRDCLPDPSDGGVESGADDNAPCFAGGDVGTREDKVLLVLVDGPGVGHRVGVLDDRDGLASKDGLVDPERRRQDLNDPDVGRDLVANCNTNH